MKRNTWLFMAALVLGGGIPIISQGEPIPKTFESQGEDRTAIQTLLENYTHAVSVKDQGLFESLLLNTSIPFSSARSAIKAGGDELGTHNYLEFAQGVFAGPSFTQTFRDVHIDQDGPQAAVSLVFVNESNGKSSWGWKILQLLKVDGRWKIASEFYTGHALD